MTWCILNLGGEFFCSLSKMRKCGKLRSQICQFVEEGDTFGRNAEYCINFLFDCDSPGVVYLIKCKTCSKIYVGSTITSFRKRFNNHKSSANRFAISKPGEQRENNCMNTFFNQDMHSGLEDIIVKIIDRADVNDPTRREGFWAYKLDSFVRKGLNIREFL